MTNEQLIQQLKTASIQCDEMRLRDFGYLMKIAADAIEELSKRIDRAFDIYNRNVEKTAMYEVLVGIAPEPPKEESRCALVNGK